MDDFTPRRKPRTSAPAASFDPRYKELLLKGSLAEVTLNCKTPKQATKLRHEISIYRSRCRHEKIDGWELLYKAILIIHKEKPSTLLITPRGAQFDSVLAGAVFRETDVKPVTTPSSDFLADFEPEKER